MRNLLNAKPADLTVGDHLALNAAAVVVVGAVFIVPMVVSDMLATRRIEKAAKKAAKNES